MDKKQRDSREQEDLKHTEIQFTEVKNAHAAGDGAIEKSDEKLESENDISEEEPGY